jgi:hypothetical protein
MTALVLTVRCSLVGTLAPAAQPAPRPPPLPFQLALADHRLRLSSSAPRSNPPSVPWPLERPDSPNPSAEIPHFGQPDLLVSGYRQRPIEPFRMVRSARA